jgi:plastocyanin domain-containing protein
MRISKSMIKKIKKNISNFYRDKVRGAKKSFLLGLFIPLTIIMFVGIYFTVTNFSGFGFVSLAASKDIEINSNDAFQEVNMDLSYAGYSPNVLNIKKGIPVRWNINVKQMTGCTNSIMIESLGIKKDLQIGNNVIEFTPPDDVDEIKFSCWMRMVWGKFVVADDSVNKSRSKPVQNTSSLQTNGGCNGNCGSPTCGASRGGGCGCGSR